MRGQDDEKGKNSFVFYHEWAEHVADQPDEVRLEFFDAIVSYSSTGEIPALGPSLRMAFKFIKAQMDRDKAKYGETRKKRSEAGKKGMKSRYSKKDERITNDNKNNNVINVITPITNITDNVDVDVDDDVDVDVDVDVDDDVTTRMNTSVCEYNGAHARARSVVTCGNAHAKPDGDGRFEAIIARQQQEDEKARQFEITLYQNDGAQVMKTDRPTEEQVFEHMCKSLYVREDVAREEARKFVNHYKANGWMVGKQNPMIDWQASVENWIDNINNYGNRQQQANEEGRRNFVAAIRNVEERARYEEEHGKDELPF